jgi:hypothetical protein
MSIEETAMAADFGKERQSVTRQKEQSMSRRSAIRKKAGTRKYRIMSLAFIAFVVGNLVAEDLGVSYVEGNVAISSGSDWSGLAIGDSVRPEASLRLGKDAYLELTASGNHITISQPGTYSVQDLLRDVNKMRSAGTGTALVNTFSRLFTGFGQSQSVVGGVRGGDKSKSEENEWITSDVQVFLEDGRNYLASGNYEKAIEELQRALDTASEEELPEVEYLLAYAYSLNGNTRDALKWVSELQPTGGEEWASNFVLLKAKLFIDTNAFAQDVQWLSDHGAALAQDAQLSQVYYFLLALGYRGLADTTGEQVNLAKAVSISPSSDVGKAAAQLAKNP